MLSLGQLQLAIQIVDFMLVSFQTRFGGRLRGLFLSLLSRDLAQLTLDLPAALLVALLPLSELEAFQLALVVVLFERRTGNAQLGEVDVSLHFGECDGAFG